MSSPHNSKAERRSWASCTATYAAWTLRNTWRNGEQLLLIAGIPLVVLVVLTQTTLVADTDAPLTVVAAMIVLGSGFTSPAITIAFDRRYGNYAFLGTTPLPRSSIIGGTLASIAVSAALAVIVVIAVGSIMGIPVTAAQVVHIIAAVLLGLAAVVPWAFVLGGTARSETVLVVANGIFIVATLFGGVLVPIDALPFGAALQWFPPAAIVGLGADGSQLSALILIAWSALGAAVAVRTFRWR